MGKGPQFVHLFKSPIRKYAIYTAHTTYSLLGAGLNYGVKKCTGQEF